MWVVDLVEYLVGNLVFGLVALLGKKSVAKLVDYLVVDSVVMSVDCLANDLVVPKAA